MIVRVTPEVAFRARSHAQLAPRCASFSRPRVLYVLDFIPHAMHAAIAARTCAADVSAYVQAAVDTP